MNLKTMIAMCALVAVAALPAVSDAQWQGRGKKVGHYKNGKASSYNSVEARRRREAEARRRQVEAARRQRDAIARRNYEARKREIEAARRRRDAVARRDYERKRAQQLRGSSYRPANWSSAQQKAWSDEYRRRQDKKNEWRNIAIGAGAVGVLGLLKHDNTLTFAGLGGALYSLNRYEQDRKSQNSLKKARANYFSRDYFIRDGQRYQRRLVTKNGQRYYQFVRA